MICGDNVQEEVDEWTRWKYIREIESTKCSKWRSRCARRSRGMRRGDMGVRELARCVCRKQKQKDTARLEEKGDTKIGGANDDGSGEKEKKSKPESSRLTEKAKKSDDETTRKKRKKETIRYDEWLVMGPVSAQTELNR